jgi:hypothetical protein
VSRFSARIPRLKILESITFMILDRFDPNHRDLAVECLAILTGGFAWVAALPWRLCDVSCIIAVVSNIIHNGLDMRIMR